MSGYLTFTPSDGAKLVLTYSDNPIPEALLVAKPTKAIPGFKRNKAEELIKGLQQDKSKYFAGIAQYVKAIRVYGGVVEIGPGNAPIPFQVVFLDPKNEVRKLSLGDRLPVTDYVAVAVVNAGSRDFEAKSLDKNLFLSKGRSCGGATLELK